MVARMTPPLKKDSDGGKLRNSYQYPISPTVKLKSLEQVHVHHMLVVFNQACVVLLIIFKKFYSDGSCVGNFLPFVSVSDNDCYDCYQCDHHHSYNSDTDDNGQVLGITRGI